MVSVLGCLKALHLRLHCESLTCQYINKMRMRMVEQLMGHVRLADRLQALTHLLDIISNEGLRDTNSQYIVIDEIMQVDWLTERQILTKLVLEDGHTELIKKAEEVFKYVVKCGALGEYELEGLYRTGQRTEFETGLAVYRLLQRTAYLFKGSHVRLLMNAIIGTDLADIKPEDVELLCVLSAYTNVDVELGGEWAE